jgi:tRNA G46 methylase TrmB
MFQYLATVIRVFRDKRIPYKVAVFWVVTKLNFLRRIFPKKRNVSVRYRNLKIFGNSYINLDFIFGEIFINNEYYIDLGKKDPVIFDCGSNIGCATLFFLQQYPQANITAFEPQPLALEYLKKNIGYNKLNNVSICSKALGNTDH